MIIITSSNRNLSTLQTERDACDQIDERRLNNICVKIVVINYPTLNYPIFTVLITAISHHIAQAPVIINTSRDVYNEEEKVCCESIRPDPTVTKRFGEVCDD